MSGQKSVRVNFVLPYVMDVPVGGYKVVYQYANALAKRGHDARVVLPKSLAPRTGTVGEIKNALWPKMHRMHHPQVVTWFPIDPRVKLILAADIREKWLPEADYTVATFWKTAPLVNQYSAKMGTKLYLVQHLETFAGPYDDVVATWRLPLYKLVISKWLAKFAESLGQESTYLPNGLNFDDFGIDIPIEQRQRKISMLYHTDVVKGAWDGINALEIVKERFPDLSVVVFGVPERPGLLPTWMEYVRNASTAQLREIYNSSSIFLHPSWSEGWPAPPAEAMACGAAIVAAANEGVMDYLVEGETGITSRPKYWLELAEKITSVLSDDDLRISIAKKGAASIRWYTLDRATDTLEKLLVEGVPRQ